MQDKLRNSSILNMLLMGFLYTLDARAPRVVLSCADRSRSRVATDTYTAQNIH